MKLYEINAEFAAIIEELESNGGELTPELEEALAINDQDHEAKIEAYIKAIRNYTADAEAAHNEMAFFKTKEERAKKTAERLKETVLASLQARGIDKAKYGDFTAAVRRSERVVVDEDCLAILPDDFKRVKTTVEADKTALKTALKAGMAIEGVTLADSYSLNIR